MTSFAVNLGREVKGYYLTGTHRESVCPSRIVWDAAERPLGVCGVTPGQRQRCALALQGKLDFAVNRTLPCPGPGDPFSEPTISLY